MSKKNKHDDDNLFEVIGFALKTIVLSSTGFITKTLKSAENVAEMGEVITNDKLKSSKLESKFRLEKQLAKLERKKARYNNTDPAKRKEPVKKIEPTKKAEPQF